MTTRRAFLAGTAALATGGTALAIDGPPSDKGNEPDLGAKGTPPADLGITEATLAEAEKLMAVEYTAEERSLMLETVGRFVDRAKQRRTVDLPEGLAPAVTFDPRLPTSPKPETGPFSPSGKDAGPLPGNAEDIAFAPLTSLAQWLRKGRVTSVELTQLYLARLKEFGPRLECVVTLLEDRALREAQAADREITAGRYRGPLHGIPYGAKDLFDTAGDRTTWGAAPYKDRVAQGDAAVIARLGEAGAVLAVKTTLGALAFADKWFGGMTRNPWNLAEGSSGSSAGSAAAVAAGLVGFALGTETLGSIVAPCMRCGTTGLRPTFGRIPRTGAMALAWSMDKIGPICRTVEDTALVLDVLNGGDDSDPGSLEAPFAFDGARSVEGMRVGWSPAWFEGERVTEVDRAGLAAVRRTGVEMVKVDLPDLPYSSLIMILEAEAAAAFEELTLSGRDDELTHQGPRDHPNNFRQARFISAVDFVQAERLRRKSMGVMDQAFRGLDAMISPSSGPPLLIVTNFTGQPSLTLRTGYLKRATRSSPGDQPERGPGSVPESDLRTVPHAVTLWWPLFGEGRLLNIGMALEAELDIWHHRPPLA